MRFVVTIVLLLLMSGVSAPGHAHELQLDNNGCHQDGRYGLYHCHEGDYADESFISRKDYPGITNHNPRANHMIPIKMNSAGVCLPPESILYERQKKYWVYQSVEQCLRDGGRLDGAVVID